MPKRNPLDIPEIISLIGYFIPLWVPQPDPHESDLIFQPQNLAGLLRVNRTWNALLTPFLWPVYDGYRMQKVPLEAFLKNCHHIRYLSQYSWVLAGGQVELSCTMLKYLVIKRYELAGSRRFAMANPNLEVLSWSNGAGSDSEDFGADGYNALRSLTKLKQLRLSRWELDPVELWSVLRGYPDLQKLSLNETKGLHSFDFLESFSWSTPQQQQHQQQDYDSSASPLPRRNLQTPLQNIQTLWVDFEWENNMGVIDLVRYCPNLEQLYLHADSDCDYQRLKSNLRQFCPKLNTIRCVDGFMAFQIGMIAFDEGFVALIESTDRLVHFEMAICELEETILAALLRHSKHLETVVLYICTDEVHNFKNVGRLLSGCPKLKVFGLSPYLSGWSVEDGSEMFATTWACAEQLQELRLDGFVSEVEGGVVEVEESGEEMRVKRAPNGWQCFPSKWSQKDRLTSVQGKAFLQKVFQVVESLPKLTLFCMGSDRYERI